LESVTIKNEKRGEWFFPCDQWFDKSVGDGLLVREIKPSENGATVASQSKFISF
jgi:hypothetical protein